MCPVTFEEVMCSEKEGGKEGLLLLKALVEGVTPPSNQALRIARIVAPYEGHSPTNMKGIKKNFYSCRGC
jgi:hypothetical protein